MQRTNLDKKIAFMDDEPRNVRLMDCSVCKIKTNHFRTPNGWQCRVCDDVVRPDQRPGFPSGSLDARRDFILYELAQGRAELTDDVIGELAELDGSDTSWAAQLNDAGFGSAAWFAALPEIEF